MQRKETVMKALFVSLLVLVVNVGCDTSLEPDPYAFRSNAEQMSTWKFTKNQPPEMNKRAKKIAEAAMRIYEQAPAIGTPRLYCGRDGIKVTSSFRSNAEQMRLRFYKMQQLQKSPHEKSQAIDVPKGFMSCQCGNIDIKDPRHFDIHNFDGLGVWPKLNIPF